MLMGDIHFANFTKVSPQKNFALYGKQKLKFNYG